MRKYRFSHEWIAREAPSRPAGYLDELRAIALSEDGRGLWIDLDGDGYRGMLKKYRGIDAPAAPTPSRGLGDTIARITTALGVKPCGGCKKRAEALNRLVPYRQGSD